MKSFHIITFGCQMNEHDSERMAGVLEGGDYVPSKSAEDADIVILNTCSIREKAEQKFYSELGRLRKLKTVNPGLKIAVAGCIAQQEGRGILSRAPHVDMVLGTSSITGLQDLVDRAYAGSSAVVDTAEDPDYHKKLVPARRNDYLKAWVSIMYGCDNFCAYCVVPYLRGRERSRPPEDIVQEVRELAEKGCMEITLLGQNVNSYGKGAPRNVDFPDLLGMVSDVAGIERIRFVTSHPRDLSDKLIHAVRDLPKVCESLHLPIQSGSDKILSAMNRRYTREEYLDKVKRLRDAVPDIALTTDIIVGFPGETEQDFAMILDLLKEVRFDGIFSFKYSRRPNTAALNLEGHLPENVKEPRLSEVLSVQGAITLESNRRLIGTIQEVLVDGVSKKGGKMTGRTRGNKVVNFHGNDSLIGALVRVRVASAGANSLTGEIDGIW